MGHHQEIEVKFRVDDLDAVRRRLTDLGAKRIGQGHEENLIFDDAAGRLRAAGEVLRLRRDRRCTLTFKSPVVPSEPGAGQDSRFKVRREVEVEVGDCDAARTLLEALGYQVATGYDKDRETWRCDGTEVLLDRLGIGCFVEVEGDPHDIERVTGLLGLDLAKGITRSYLDLLEESGR